MSDPSSTRTVDPPPAPPSEPSNDAATRWDLTRIFPDWGAWEAACVRLGREIDDYASLQGRLAEGPAVLREALERSDRIGALSHEVWYFPALRYDLDQRDNDVNARRQRVQALFARWEQASAWFAPEALALSWERIDGWLEEDRRLAVYRFSLEDLFRRAEHILDEAGERLLSYASRFNDAPDEAYAALSTADAEHPRVTLSDGSEVTLTPGAYRAALATRRSQDDRRAVFEAHYGMWAATANTYAALYNGVCQRDWFHARARGYSSTLEAALDGDAIPTSVVDRLIETAQAGTEPLRRYHRVRARALGLESYHLYDTAIPLVPDDPSFEYREAVEHVTAASSALGSRYRELAEGMFAGGWIDVFELPGKRSGAYSAGVYGVHPYILLNFTRTLDDVFTVAHEVGHAIHTLLSQEAQPYVYSRYSIAVAEVASTLAEALLLDRLLEAASSSAERVLLLQHAIDGILGTFYTQVLFARWELEMHRLVETGEPLTAETLGRGYLEILESFYGDAATIDDRYRFTWCRIPHFYQSPYYVYQYATSHAASAQIAEELRRAATDVERHEVVDRYLELLRAGGSDHPVELLRRAGVDLTSSEPFEATVAQLDRLVDRLEAEIDSPAGVGAPP